MGQTVLILGGGVGGLVAANRRLLARRDADGADDEPADALAKAQADSVQLPVAVGHAAATGTPAARRRCALVEGFSLHANTSVDAADRAGLERLSRYLLRPMISPDRLTVRPDGRVVPVPSSRSHGPDFVGDRRRLLVPPARHADPSTQEPHDEISRRVRVGAHLAPRRRSDAVAGRALRAHRADLRDRAKSRA